MTNRWLKAAIYSGVLVLIAQLFVAWGHAQNSGARGPGKSTAGEERGSAQSADFGNQLARESREAAGEEKGETDALRKSPAVQFVARVTGTSLEHAYWLSMLLNFALIAAAMVWLSRLHLPGLFRSRTESIQSAMKEARKATDDANRRLADIESRLAKLDSEIASMQTKAEKEAAAEETRIREAADEDRRKIVRVAQQEIAAAAKAARRELKGYAADLAVALAERQIRVDHTTDQALVRSFAERLGDESNGTGKDGH
jgi:F-type H+-transporting ATPase subunit b